MVDFGDKVNRARGIIDGMIVSGSNAVIFRDEYEVWFQIYLGLFFSMPTIVLIQKSDNEKFGEKLKELPVKILELPKFDSKHIAEAAHEIESFVKSQQ